jgi:hypothetical protein
MKQFSLACVLLGLSVATAEASITINSSEIESSAWAGVGTGPIDMETVHVKFPIHETVTAIAYNAVSNLTIDWYKSVF